jgi:hypothetical protein
MQSPGESEKKRSPLRLDRVLYDEAMSSVITGLPLEGDRGGQFRKEAKGEVGPEPRWSGYDPGRTDPDSARWARRAGRGVVDRYLCLCPWHLANNFWPEITGDVDSFYKMTK